MALPPDATENSEGQHVQALSTSNGSDSEEAAANGNNIPARMLVPGAETVARQVGLRNWSHYDIESIRFYHKWITYEIFLDSEEEILQGVLEIERYRTRDTLQLHIEVYAEQRMLNVLHMYFLGYKPRDN